jgi:hypothetical protein
MTAQRAALVVAAEQPALAQDGHDLAGKQLQLLRDHRWHHIEAIGGARAEPVFDGVRHLLGRAGNRQMPARPCQSLEH